ncbi:reverse transcriptase family protein [Massilia sp. DWR3-1-1]|uniref:reverse transcriptase family protein n=1 Tax=Massilia sp. DWR3-1-1 TaxID=2804559 RepID=UPI003CED70D7
MNRDKLALLALADTMLASSATPAALEAACERVFGMLAPWALVLCAAVLARTGENFYYFSRHELAEILAQQLAPSDDGDGDEGDDADDGTLMPFTLPPVRRYCIDPALLPPAPAWLTALSLPVLDSVGALASWLNEPVDALAWFADQWRLAGAQPPPLQHYHYRWVPKRSGGLRLIEIPKARLRRIQGRILRQILDRVPPHPAAHGFRRSHSCLSHAALHTGQALVLRMDLQDFFPSIPGARIHALFEKLGYRPAVAGVLARICVNRTPPGVLRAGQAGARPGWAQRQVLASAHLPQGSPCSPALANLCAYRLDLRLAALARTLEARYSRYADDLVFSGGAQFGQAAARFAVQVAAIAAEEGFCVNHRKTRAMRQGTRQQVTGVVVNRHPNIARADYDRLKAILSNCVRHGPASQNREGRADFRAWLAGKVAYVAMLNAPRALKLQRLAAAIVWPTGC